jgi:hypothetical protein
LSTERKKKREREEEEEEERKKQERKQKRNKEKKRKGKGTGFFHYSSYLLTGQVPYRQSGFPRTPLSLRGRLRVH